MGSERSTPTGDRRDFLRRIARDGVNSASALLGAVGAVRTEAEALSNELQGTVLGVAPGGVQPPRRRAAEASLALAADAGLVAVDREAPDPAFATPVRDEANAVIVLDVRALPAQIIERRADSAAAIAALLAVDAVAPGPIRGLAASFGLSLAAEGALTTRAARMQAAAAALRNADPLNDALEVEIAAALAATDPLAPIINARAAARLVAYAAAAEQIRSALNDVDGAIATGPGLGATTWGDLAPVHEALRQRATSISRAAANGRNPSTLLIAMGPTVDPAGSTHLGTLDAADALRVGLTPELLGEGELGARIVAGKVGALILAVLAQAADGAIVLPAGGAALAALARAARIPLLLIATPRRERPDATVEALASRVADFASTRDARPAAARGAARGTLVAAPRVDLVSAAALRRAGKGEPRVTIITVG